MPLISLPSLLGLASVLVFLAALFGRALWARHAARLADAQARSSAYEQPVTRDRDMHSIVALYKLRPRSDSNADTYDLGDRAWRDLSLDAVFAHLDRCITPLGQQLLYGYLRAPSLTLEPLLARDRCAAAFASSPSLRSDVGTALRPLTGLGAASLGRSLFGPPAPLPRGAALFPLATVATLVAAMTCFFKPIALLALFASIATNIAIRVTVFRDLSAHVDGLHHVARLLDVARALAKLDAASLAPQLTALREALTSLGGRRVSVAWLTLDRLRLDEMSAMVVEYANVLLLLDVNAFARELAFAHAHNRALADVFLRVAEIDAALSIANYRAGEPATCIPELRDGGGTLSIVGMRHPLVHAAVPNDVTLGDQGYIVTGSNMAGKSTFLKAVALQAVLAQSIFTATAARYAAPFLRVQTLVEIADDLLAGRSHFRVEAEVARAMLGSDADSHAPRLCVVDELFRGTNTTDRIAAGTAFLRALQASGAFVVAATHDRELLDLLRAQYAPHHFTETIAAGELTFDYRLRSGAAAPRNALAVLAIAGFPKAVLDEANAVAASLEAGRAQGLA